MTSDFSPEMEQRQTVAGREFLTQFEFEWLSFEEIWGVPLTHCEGFNPQKIGRAVESRYFVEGEEVSKEDYYLALDEAVQFAQLVDAPIITSNPVFIEDCESGL